MGSDESHFNVSVGSDGQSHKTVSTNHNLFEEKGEPSGIEPTSLPLGQTGSRSHIGLSTSLICQPTSEDIKQHNTEQQQQLHDHVKEEEHEKILESRH